MLFAELDRLNFPAPDRIENPQPERGMFSSIVCAANWVGWKPDISSWAIVLGDQPHLRSETLRELQEFSAQSPSAVCQPQFDGRERHPVILPRRVFVELKTSGADSLKDFLESVSCPRVQFATNDSSLALDLDTPEDYQRAQAAI
jgi:CTP:molybdopterin cytidylyltransferase MocA